MKYRGFCDAPADDRGVYVEADSADAAYRKMVQVIQVIYDCEASDVSIYNITSEANDPDILEFETGWSGGQAIAWDDDPIIAYRSASEAMRSWANKPILQRSGQ